MEYKRKIIQLFKQQVDQELENYSREYQKILRDTTVILSDSSCTKENADNKLEENPAKSSSKTNRNVEISDDNLLLTPTKDNIPLSEHDSCIHDSEPRIEYQVVDTSIFDPVPESRAAVKSTRPDRKQLNSNEDIELEGNMKDIVYSNAEMIDIFNQPRDNASEAKSDAKNENALRSEHISKFVYESDICNDTRTKTLPKIKSCTIDQTFLEGESRLFDNTLNICSTNQTFCNSEFRRKARRRMGKSIPKRPCHMMDEYQDDVKRTRFDQLPSFFDAYQSMLKEKQQAKVDLEKYEELKAKFRKYEEAIANINAQEKERIDKINEETTKALNKIHDEMSKLNQVKSEISNDIKSIQLERQNIKVERNKIKAHSDRIKEEKRKLEEERKNAAMKLEMEAKRLEDERRREEVRLRETIRIEEERRICAEEKLKIEREEMEKIKQGKLEAQSIELTKIEQTKKQLEEEWKRIKEEKDKINQTFLEASFREPQRPKDCKIQIPPLANASFLVKKSTIKVHEKPNVDLNLRFQLAKREHAGLSSKNVENPKITHNKIQQNPINVKRMNPHSLYKSSIDAQSNSIDPKKYVPQTVIPFYQNEDEFESDSKKFAPATFTKDPKLNYIVKNQNHSEIREFFGNRREIDVELIFSGIENVSNSSPNKLKRSN